MGNSVDKDVRKLIRECTRRNVWCVEHTGGGHLKWSHANGFFFSALSPSDHRVLRKIKKQIECMEAGRPNIGR